MFSKISPTFKFKGHKFAAANVQARQSRGISTYAFSRFEEEWSNVEKQKIAKELTLNTIVSTSHDNRVLLETKPPIPGGKGYHPSIIHALASTYGFQCAVDKIEAICPEHILLMRTAVGVARNPDRELLEAAYAVAELLGKELVKLSPRTLESIFEIGSSIKESRSKDVLEDHSGLVKILVNHRNVPPQQFLRVLEVVLSPLGMLANGYGSNYDKIKNAVKEGKDIGDLASFMDDIMTSLGQFHVPYIKAPGSPFAHLQMKQYMQGADISDEELVTVNHFLECLSSDKKNIPDIPQLRSVIVKDPTGRTLHLHDRLNLPHFFDVSGTTGAVMQAAMGLLHRAGKLNLVNDSETVIRFGMLVAGVNFYKQGYHNYYEVLPALNWVNHHINKEEYKQLTPAELVRAVPEALKQCVNQSSAIAPIINDAMNLATEHFELHEQLYKEDIKERFTKTQQSASPAIFQE